MWDRYRGGCGSVFIGCQNWDYVHQLVFVDTAAYSPPVSVCSGTRVWCCFTPILTWRMSRWTFVSFVLHISFLVSKVESHDAKRCWPPPFLFKPTSFPWQGCLVSKSSRGPFSSGLVECQRMDVLHNFLFHCGWVGGSKVNIGRCSSRT